MAEAIEGDAGTGDLKRYAVLGATSTVEAEPNSVEVRLLTFADGNRRVAFMRYGRLGKPYPARTLTCAEAFAVGEILADATRAGHFSREGG